MKKIFLCELVVAFILLVGCSNNYTGSPSTSDQTSSSSSYENLIHTSSTDSSTSATSSQTISSTSPSEISQSKTLLPRWSGGQSDSLQEYMNEFGQIMHQSYIGCTPDFNTTYQNLEVPADFLTSTNYHVAIEGQSGQSTISWTNDGWGSADYNVFACYTDYLSTGTGESHLYFFTFHQDSLVILVCMQEQADNTNTFYFHETENQDLKDNVAQILTYKGDTSPAGGNVNNSTNTVSAAPSFDQAKEALENIDKNSDFGYADFGVNTDNNGEFRRIKVVSRSIRQEGGTGTLGFRKVYANGTISDYVSSVD